MDLSIIWLVFYYAWVDDTMISTSMTTTDHNASDGMSDLWGFVVYTK